jgi:hypothetical protein
MIGATRPSSTGRVEMLHNLQNVVQIPLHPKAAPLPLQACQQSPHTCFCLLRHHPWLVLETNTLRVLPDPSLYGYLPCAV